MYVKVAVNIPRDVIFSYAVPDSMGKEAVIGKQVMVPFGNRVATGYIVETHCSQDLEDIKEIKGLLSHDPLFGEEDLFFYRWVSHYYLYPLGKTLFDILPSQISSKKELIVSLDHDCLDRQDFRLPFQQNSLADFLALHGPTGISLLRKEFKNASYLVRCLREKGVLQTREKELYRHGNERTDLEVIDRPVVLNNDQERAVSEIAMGLSTRRFAPYLLHGVTGSGKTEVYFKLMEKTLEMNGGIIYLVPEISLTPQIIARIRARFRDCEIAMIHSGVSRSVRYDQWRRIQKGEVKFVVGARSALFVPVRDLSLIVVDEEHDGSYKQDERLRYNARDMAIVKAKLKGTAVILGSATPAVQSYYNAQNKKYTYLALPSRVERRELPAVEIVDMRNEGGKGAELPVLSRLLKREIGMNLMSQGQTLLFLNRRGFNTLIFCSGCGSMFKCRNCELSLTYHASLGVLRCHTCDYCVKAFPVCPKCGQNQIRSYGIGTEKLAEEVGRAFPQARIGRMDSDATAKQGDVGRILNALDKRELDILVGTQMITKGHDFPGITLVGVVSADLCLNIPDFRAGEKAFQVLTQVAGRGGRGGRPGKVIVQTFNPDHYAIKAAKNHDYPGFYEEEKKQRMSLLYPPFTRFVNLQISCAHRDRGMAGIAMLKERVKDLSRSAALKQVEILGPVEAPIAKIRGRYRWQLLLKGKDVNVQAAVVAALRAEARKSGLEVKVDVDPMNFM